MSDKSNICAKILVQGGKSTYSVQERGRTWSCKPKNCRDRVIACMCIPSHDEVWARKTVSQHGVQSSAPRSRTANICFYSIAGDSSSSGSSIV